MALRPEEITSVLQRELEGRDVTVTGAIASIPQHESYGVRFVLVTDALQSIRYAEFCLPSCHTGSNESIHIGKNLVSFLGSYIPYLQTLRIWRPDDFPWTSSK